MMKKIKKKLGELLLEAGLIDEFQLRSALSYQEEWGGRIGSIITRKGFVTEKEMLSVIEKQYGLASVSLDDISNPPEEVLDLVKVDVAKRFGILPVKLEGRTLLIAIADPTDLKTLDDISFLLGVRVKPVLALESDIKRAIGVHYEGNVHEKAVQRIKDRVVADEKAARSADTTGRIGEGLIERLPEARRTAEAASGVRKDIPQRAVVESLIDLLILKGVFTREELLRQLQSRRRS
jgi:type IV pilus assembly protein PilB